MLRMMVLKTAQNPDLTYSSQLRAEHIRFQLQTRHILQLQCVEVQSQSIMYTRLHLPRVPWQRVQRSQYHFQKHVLEV